jgi:hypothetical protein
MQELNNMMLALVAGGTDCYCTCFKEGAEYVGTYVKVVSSLSVCRVMCHGKEFRCPKNPDAPYVGTNDGPYHIIGLSGPKNLFAEFNKVAPVPGGPVQK